MLHYFLIPQNCVFLYVILIITSSKYVNALLRLASSYEQAGDIERSCTSNSIYRNPLQILTFNLSSYLIFFNFYKGYIYKR